MFQETYIQRIVAIVGVAAICALGAYAYSAVQQTNYIAHPPVVISVTGKGEVYATPNIAEFNFSVDAKETNVATAQKKSAEAVNAIIAFLKGKGVDEKDIQTQGYNISPNYEYQQTPCPLNSYCPPGQQKLVGYQVVQTVDVKVRKTDTAGDLIAGVGGLGATNMSGLSFTIDDPEAVNAQAREKAIADAEKQAQKLAQDLGVRIVRLAGYSENGGGPIYFGMTGAKVSAMADSVVAPAPQIPTGQNLITSQVNLSFEVR